MKKWAVDKFNAFVCFALGHDWREFNRKTFILYENDDVRMTDTRSYQTCDFCGANREEKAWVQFEASQSDTGRGG